MVNNIADKTLFIPVAPVRARKHTLYQILQNSLIVFGSIFFLYHKNLVYGRLDARY
jgi:hypothetical protein